MLRKQILQLEAGRLVKGIWTMVKPLLDKKMTSKIEFVNNKDHLDKHMDTSVLPGELGKLAAFHSNYI